MALDTFGNYVAGIEPFPAPYPPSSTCCRSGIGAPDDADGSDGQTYVDLTTGDLYIKTNGVWSIYSSGGGSLVTLGVVEPEGVVTAEPGAAYLNTALQTFHIKKTGSGNTGWQQIA